MIFSNRRAVFAAVGTAVVVALPVMADHGPPEILAALIRWKWAIYSVGAIVFAYCLLCVGYLIGHHTGLGSGQARAEIAPPAKPGNATFDDIILAARSVTNAVIVEGRLRVAPVLAYVAALEGAHPVWYDEAALHSRDALIALVNQARDARRATGDFKGSAREEYVNLLLHARDELVSAVQRVSEEYKRSPY
jgi:hypothetical protein